MNSLERYLCYPGATKEKRPGRLIITCKQCEKRWRVNIEPTGDKYAEPEPQTLFKLRCGHVINFRWDSALETVRTGRIIGGRIDGLEDPPLHDSDISEEALTELRRILTRVMLRLETEKQGIHVTHSTQ